MPLIHWKPFEGLEDLFENFPTNNGWDLAADVYEENNNVIVKMNIPGINSENIDIQIEDNHLHITGTREEEREVKNKKYYRKEIMSGSFERVIHLPCAVSSDRATAEFSDGVLQITLPKAAKTKETNKITVTKK